MCTTAIFWLCCISEKSCQFAVMIFKHILAFLSNVKTKTVVGGITYTVVM